MILQFPDLNYRTVSYRKELKDEFAKAAQNKSPVKVTVVKRKPNYFDKTKTEKEVTNNTVLEILEENAVAFEYIKYKQIDENSENEKYFLERVTAREWPAGVLNLATAPHTKVTPSNKEISQTRSVLPELATFKVSFPLLSIISCEVQCFCPQCNKLAKRNDGRLFQCSYCNSRTLFSALIKNYTLTLSCIMSQNGQTHFKNLAANAARFSKCV